MAFNFKQFTANNPLLKEIDAEGSSFPRVEFEEAVVKALKAGIDKNTLHKIIDWN